MAIKKKIMISIVVVLIFTALIIYFIILPTIYDIKHISDTIYAERVDLEKKYLRGQLLKTTIREFKAAKPAQDRLSSVFITEGNELEFITTLEKIAGSLSLQQNLTLQQTVTKNYLYYSQPMVIKINGDFIQILRYLKDLEKANHYFNIFSLSLNDNGNNVTATFQGEVFALVRQNN
jgi:Tfp pilus assembly protein PilO